MKTRKEPPVWMKVKEAAFALGNSFTRSEISRWVRQQYPSTKANTIGCQTTICTVNNPVRVQFTQNSQPRTKASQYDFLFAKQDGTLVWYSPAVHGWWIIARGANGKLVIRQSSRATTVRVRNLPHEPTTSDFSELVRTAITSGGAGGESEHHRLLKKHIATHPNLVGLAATVANGVMEYALPSGDELDVLFREDQEWIAVEVKSYISGNDDLVRGLFQCVKYQAVLKALLLSTGRSPNVRTVLATGRPWPEVLLPLRNILGVEVIHITMPTATV